MIKYSSELLLLLDSFIQDRLSLNDLCDRLFPYLELSVYEHARSDWEVAGEILACIYEVNDGVMQEEAFRDVIQEFLTDPPALRPRKVSSRRRAESQIWRRRIRTMVRSGQRSKRKSRTLRLYASRTLSTRVRKPPHRRAFTMGG